MLRLPMSSVICCCAHMNNNFIQVLLIFFGGVLCLLPLAAKPSSDFSHSDLFNAVPSQRNRDSAVAAFALGLPILAEIVVEVITSISTKGRSEKVKIHFGRQLLNTRERFLLACGILTIPITAFLPASTFQLINIYLCLRKCRFIFVGGTVITSLSRYDVTFWSVRKTYSILSCIIGGSVLGSFSENNNQHAGRQSSPLSIFAYGLYLLALMILLYCNTRWLLSITPTYFAKQTSKPWLDGGSQKDLHITDAQLLIPLLYVITTGLVSVLLSIVFRVSPEIDAYNADALFFHHLGLVLYVVLIMYLSDRMMKYDVIRGLYTLIESKKVYVRYISHELRTPLNTAFLGLKLVCDDLKVCTDDRNLDHCETLLDVQSACRTAVEILNDLLCFDKLESGILELHKHEVPAVPFITDCVNMFASQAREAEVTITHTTLIGDIPTDDNIVPYFDAEDLSDYLTPNLLHSDIVTMDKFKMDQVVRNLISNALKYTPRGGSVTVCASFVPDVVDDTIPLKKSGERSKGSSFRMDVPVLSQQWLRSKGQFVSDKQDLELGIPRERSDMVIEDETGNCERTFRSCESREATAPNSNISTFRQSSIAPTGSARAFGDTQDKVLPVINGKLRIVVQDTGVGISESNQVHLFKEIVQFNPEVLQAGGGSGLGLWITSSIVQMHAGTIKVHSDGIGKGSTFTVEIDMQRQRVPSNTGRPLAVVMNTHSRGSLASASLPDEDKRSPVRTDDYCPRPLDLSRVIQCLNAASCDESEHPTSMPTRRCTVPEPRTPPILESKSFGEYDDPPPLREVYDVLVVDDSSLNRKLLCKLFRQSRYTCDEANDGMIAVNKVKARMAHAVRGKYQYDAILMDFVMPVMDGPTATQIIRSLGYTGPIFGVTGNALESDVNYFTSSGVNAVLAKPFDFAHFKKLMKDLGPPSPPPGFGDEV